VTVFVVIVVVVPLIVTVRTVRANGTVVVEGTLTTVVVVTWLWTGWRDGIWAVVWVAVRDAWDSREVEFDAVLEMVRERGPGLVVLIVLTPVPELVGVPPGEVEPHELTIEAPHPPAISTTASRSSMASPGCRRTPLQRCRRSC
jgi:hypothetical protein